MTRDDEIERFLRAVSDRCDADWNELERTSITPEDHELVRNLRALRKIADHGAPLAVLETEAPRDAWAHLTLLRKIGEGSYGEVHRAWDPKLSIDVALKLIPSRFASPDEALREGRLLARVRHENVARVYGVDHRDGFVGIWTEYVDGVTLQDVARDAGPLPGPRLLATARPLLSALVAIHGANVLHRDLKPENILVDRDGRLVVTDFGCGVTRDRTGADRRVEFAGTPRFMAPELFEGGAPTPGTDCYALGVVLFLLATGSYPFAAGDVASLRTEHARGTRDRLAVLRPDLSPVFTASVDRALESDPARRFRSAREWLDALDASDAIDVPAAQLPSSPLPARVRRPARRAALVAIAGLAAVVAAASWMANRPAPPLAFEAQLLQSRDDAPFRPLPPGGGASVRVGDRLMLTFRSPRAAHVYVLNWDDAGRAYLLFPMEGSELHNPLSGGIEHRLPGLVGGAPFAWEVSSASGAEHFAVVTSADRLDAFERALRETPRVQVEGAGPLPASALDGLLRGVGRAKPAPTAAGDGPAALLDELQRRLEADPALARRIALRIVTVPNSGH